MPSSLQNKRCTSIDIDEQAKKIDVITTLQASFLTFTQFFFELLNGREFTLSNPTGRESHFITIAKELTKCARLETLRLYIAVPPGHGKSTLCSYWIAWTMSRYPDSQYLYLSYSKSLAAKHTETVRRIMQLPEYGDLFNVYIRHDARGKENFQTTAGGEVAAFGATGSVTGKNSGLPNLERFSGALIMDDMHKPDEVHSDTVRASVIQNYRETIQQRLRGINVPMICIAQRLHEQDLPAFLIEGGDGHEWKQVVLPALDVNNNALYPEKDTKENLLIKQKTDIYTFASQFQQNPQPAGGSLFKPDMFPILDETPEILMTFITADTAETTKSYNDATAFGFFGLYEIENYGHKTGQLGLHWLDCSEIRVEPKDLKDEFMTFWNRCQTFKVPPHMAAIEKKSTGVTLLSILSDLRGLEIRNIERSGKGQNKTQRFLNMQPHIAAKRISFTDGARHIRLCVDHMKKITANDTHAFDDIADTLADAVNIAFIDKSLHHQYLSADKSGARRHVAEQLSRRIKTKQRVYYE